MSYPPLYTPSGQGAAKRPPSRFTVGMASDGFEVVDFDGRAVACREDRADAMIDADHLNSAAFSGSASLARALVRMP